MAKSLVEDYRGALQREGREFPLNSNTIYSAKSDRRNLLIQTTLFLLPFNNDEGGELSEHIPEDMKAEFLSAFGAVELAKKDSREQDMQNAEERLNVARTCITNHLNEYLNGRDGMLSEYTDEALAIERTQEFYNKYIIE